MQKTEEKFVKKTDKNLPEKTASFNGVVYREKHGTFFWSVLRDLIKRGIF